MKSSKLPLIVLSSLVLTVSAASFLYFSSDDQIEPDALSFSGALVKPEILSFVPADTIAFFGGLKSAPFKETLEVFMANQDWVADFDWQKELERTQQNKPIPAAGKFMFGLFEEYYKALQDPSTVGAKIGVGDNLESAIYFVGIFPVMRVKLQDVSAFKIFIENSESHSQLASDNVAIEGQELKTYSFDLPDDPEPSNIKLVLGVIDDYAVFTLSAATNQEQNLKLALGLDKPASSLSDSQYLEELQNKYQFHPEYLGYVNHKQVMQGVTNKNGNSFAKMLNTFIEKNSLAASNARGTEDQSTNPLAELQTPACQKELLAITDTWPRTVFGYTELNLAQKPTTFMARMVIEVTDNQLLSRLKTLHGFVPEHLRKISSESWFGLGLGVNVDAVLPFLTDLFTEITQAKYECESLINMQQALINSGGPAAVGMFAGMLAGVQGISAELYGVDGSIDLVEQQQAIKSVDALLTISSKNPQALLMTASAMIPGLASIQIPQDGTPVDFPMPLPLEAQQNTKIALKDKHIVIFSGKKAEQSAAKMQNQALEQNAWLGLNFDYSIYAKLFDTNLDRNPEDRVITPEKQEQIRVAEMIEKQSIDMQLNETVNVIDEGIAIDMRARYK